MDTTEDKDQSRSSEEQKQNTSNISGSNKAEADSSDPDLSSDEKAAEDFAKEADDATKLADDLMRFTQTGELSKAVVDLLQELHAQISLAQMQPSLTAMELINQVLEEPQVLWTRGFFDQLQHKLPLDQKEVVLSWFVQMTGLQEVYIGEIEKANNILKMSVCQGYEQMGSAQRFKDDFIARVNHTENRVYFHKKRKALQSGQYPYPYAQADHGNSFRSSSNPRRREDGHHSNGPKKQFVRFDIHSPGKRGQYSPARKSLEFERLRQETQKRSSPQRVVLSSAEKGRGSGSKEERKVGDQTRQFLTSVTFFDQISSSCIEDKVSSNAPSPAKAEREGPSPNKGQYEVRGQRRQPDGGHHHRQPYDREEHRQGPSAYQGYEYLEHHYQRRSNPHQGQEYYTPQPQRFQQRPQYDRPYYQYGQQPYKRRQYIAPGHGYSYEQHPVEHEQQPHRGGANPYRRQAQKPHVPTQPTSDSRPRDKQKQPTLLAPYFRKTQVV